MTATRVVLGGVALGSLATAVGLIWLLVVKPGALLSLIW